MKRKRETKRKRESGRLVKLAALASPVARPLDKKNVTKVLCVYM